MAATGYGTGAGLCGWNCRHSFGPYVEGAPRVWTDEKLAELNEPRYEYNGEKLTEYEAQQKENYFNRRIHRWTPEAEAMRAAGQDPSEAMVKAREWRARKTDFLSKTGFQGSGRNASAVASSVERRIESKVSARRSLARASDTFTVIPPMKGDAIKAQSIYRNLQRSEVGRHAYEYIIQHNIPVEINYTDEAPEGERGRCVGHRIEIYARHTKTVQKTTETIIHEVAHIELGIHSHSQWEESYCFAQEAKHTKPQLTSYDLRDIIKKVKELYPDYPWRRR